MDWFSGEALRTRDHCCCLVGCTCPQSSAYREATERVIMVVSSLVSLQLYHVFADPLGSDHSLVLDVALAKIIDSLGWSVLLNLLMIYSSGNAYTGRRWTAALSPFPGDACRERMDK